MGHEVLSDDVESLIRIATRLRNRIDELKERTAMLEDELKKVETKIASKIVREDAPVR